MDIAKKITGPILKGQTVLSRWSPKDRTWMTFLRCVKSTDADNSVNVNRQKETIAGD
jgi:hypothetical protein